MNKFLRTSSTRNLLSAVIGAVVVAAVGTTIAIAAIGTGPVPKRTSLANAIHRGLAAPAPTGVYARITFTDNLIDTSEIQGTDPLLGGGSGRLWWTGHHLRLEIQGNNGDAQIVVNGRSFWAYDPGFNTVFEGTLPGGGASDRSDPAGHHSLPTVAQIQNVLDRLARHLILSRAIPGDVAGEPAYSVRISPRHDNGLLGSLQLAWDVLHRAPLQIGLYARGNSTPVLQLTASDISFGRQSLGVFDIAPPSGAKIVKLMGSDRRGGRHMRSRAGQRTATGPAAVARQVPFKLHAPGTLAGRSRSTVRLLSFGGHPAALLLYGHGIGAIVVLEQSGGRARFIQAPARGDQPGLSLPTIMVNGAMAQQLQTAIGTVVRFDRAGVAYTVLGSVTASVADAAARGL